MKTLLLSTVFTGVLGSVGFVALKSAGVFSTDVAELPSAKEAVRLLREPRVRTLRRQYFIMSSQLSWSSLRLVCQGSSVYGVWAYDEKAVEVASRQFS